MGMSRSPEPPERPAERIHSGGNTQAGLSPPRRGPGIQRGVGGRSPPAPAPGPAGGRARGPVAMCHWSQRAFNPPLSRAASPAGAAAAARQPRAPGICRYVLGKPRPTSCRQPDAGDGGEGPRGPRCGPGSCPSPASLPALGWCCLGFVLVRGWGLEADLMPGFGVRLPKGGAVLGGGVLRVTRLLLLLLPRAVG